LGRTWDVSSEIKYCFRNFDVVELDLRDEMLSGAAAQFARSSRIEHLTKADDQQHPEEHRSAKAPSHPRPHRRYREGQRAKTKKEHKRGHQIGRRRVCPAGSSRTLWALFAKW
jgi:hypothetical protein